MTQWTSGPTDSDMEEDHGVPAVFVQPDLSMFSTITCRLEVDSATSYLASH